MGQTVAGHPLQTRLLGGGLDVADLVGELSLDEHDQSGPDELARAQENVLGLLAGALGDATKDMRFPSSAEAGSVSERRRTVKKRPTASLGLSP